MNAMSTKRYKKFLEKQTTERKKVLEERETQNEPEPEVTSVNRNPSKRKIKLG